MVEVKPTNVGSLQQASLLFLVEAEPELSAESNLLGWFLDYPAITCQNRGCVARTQYLRQRAEQNQCLLSHSAGSSSHPKRFARHQ